jgi:hypothetical protein
VVRAGVAWRRRAAPRPALREPNIPRAWVRWDFEWDARRGRHTILSRATDERGTSQPAAIRWNARGRGHNVPVPHPVTVS